MNMLYLIQSLHSDPVIATKTWRKSVMGSIICPACNGLDRSWYPRPINVILEECPPGVACGHVCFSGFEIFHVDLIRQLKPHLGEFILGQCCFANGSIIVDHVTCYSQGWIVERGAMGSEYRECQECGLIRPNGWRGSQYVLRSSLTDARVHQDGFGALYFDEDLAMELDMSSWSEVELEPVAIRDEPVDGCYLSCDPRDAPWREKSRTCY